MTREEKDWENGILRGIERGIQIFLQSGENTITLSVDVETAKMLASVLREYVNSPDKVPDPETGLVPCHWCGGKAGFHYSVMMRDNDCYVECGVCGEHSKVALSEDKARDAWNYSMGYRGK